MEAGEHASDARPRVLVAADDEPLLTRAIARVLQDGCDATPARSRAEGARMLRHGRWDVLMWVADYLDAASIGHAGALRRQRPGIGLCLMGRDGHAAALNRLVEADQGPVACLLRRADLGPDEVADVVRQVAHGRFVFDCGLVERMLELRSDPPALRTLSTSERETLELLALGLRNRGIAERLWKSEKAVEKQVSQLFLKLGLSPEPHLDRRVVAARMMLMESADRPAGPRRPAAVSMR